MLWVSPPVTFSLNFLLLCSFYFTGVQSDLPAEHDQESLVNLVSSVEVRRIFAEVIMSCDLTVGIAGGPGDGAGEEERGDSV